MIENLSQFATASTAFAVIPNFSEDFEANMNAGPQEAVPHVGSEKKTYLGEERESSCSSESPEEFEANMNSGSQEADRPSSPSSTRKPFSAGPASSRARSADVPDLGLQPCKAVSPKETASEPVVSLPGHPLSFPKSCYYEKPRYAKGCCCWPAKDEGILLGGTATHPKGEHRESGCSIM
eukprot:GHVP01041004.1.p1 GENE.GHVP01041004.1~~GHVP01041004.1.p1  ORF type:complete len:180 (-),score=19.40 GHVP01041004.1:56-595(-)